MQQTVEKQKNTSKWITIALAAIILLPSMYGFGSKLREFILLLSQDADGAFALMPVTNYLLASVGFFMLFVWAVMGGMFTNVEEPKYTMLEKERQLNEQFHRQATKGSRKGVTS